MPPRRPDPLQRHARGPTATLRRCLAAAVVAALPVGVLVDSNVLLDVATSDPTWSGWASQALETAANESPLAINALIYTEVSIGYERIEELEQAIPSTTFRREPLPCEAAFLAGKAFLKYRRRGGQRTSPLPDFYIGAHAAVSGFRILTRDPRRYRTYVPNVDLISPE